MKLSLWTTLTLACALLATACSPAGPTPEQVEAEKVEAEAALSSLLDELETTYNTNDASALATLYAEDAVFMPGNQPTVSGRQQIGTWFGGVFDQFTAKLTISSEEHQVAGDLGFDRGTYSVSLTPKAGGDSMEQNGRYLVVLQRQPDGTWKVARDIDNSSSPPPGGED